MIFQELLLFLWYQTKIKMHIIIADDHTIVLDGLELLLSTFDFVQRVEKANNEAMLSGLISVQLPDIVLLDIAFGKSDGREICKQLKKRSPALRIIALTSHSDMSTVKSAVQAGFDGYLLKSEDRETVIQALKTVQSGVPFFSPQVKDVFFHQGVHKHKSELTSRELEVLKLIIEEKTTREIAATLFIAEKTVENHRSNLMLKMDVKNLAGLVKKAITLGYI